MTALPGRRDLLLGVGGLVVGAGATVGIEAATGGGATAKRPPTPGEDLMVEHGVLKRVLLCYRAAADDLMAGKRVSLGAVTDAAQVIVDFIEDFHEGLEEAYVFPRLAGVSQYSALIRTLLVQHDRGRHLTATVQDIVTGGAATDAAQTSLASALAAFVRMYEAHEAWEDTVVFPALAQLTPQRTLDDLADRFATLQNKQFGDAAVSQMLGRVAGVEQQLGIADLASYTPQL